MGYQIKLAKKLSRGFTLIEVIVVVGIVGILATISISGYSSFKTHENLEITTIGVVEGIRHAQANAQSGRGDSSWGVAIFSSSITVFKGESYASRDTSFDQSLSFSGGVIASGLSEIVFTKVTGSTANTGTVILTNSYSTNSILVNGKGTLTY